MAILRRAVLREKARRRGVGTSTRIETRHPTGPLAQLFPAQLVVLRDPFKFKALLAGRRAGKTGFAIRWFADGMLAEPGSSNLFVALTIASAREIFWEPFRKENDKHGWGFNFDRSKMIVTHPNGSRLLVRGAEDMRSLEKLRGGGFRRVFVDECGAQRPSYLKYLVQEVLEPTLMDSNGELILAGTPTVQAFGYFYDITNGRLPGWSVHSWTAKDNPHVHWESFIFDPVNGLLARRNWDKDNPIYKREYLAEWSVETERLVYRFLRSRNVVNAMPQLLKRHDTWRRVLGLDFGYGNACAAVVLAYPELYGRDVYAERAWKKHNLAPSEAAEEIGKIVADHDPDVIVGDVGGLGKAYAVEFTKRWPDILIKPAKKQEKRAAIEVVSDALYTADRAKRHGLFSLEANEELHREWATLLWDDKREDVAEGQDDDLADAALYAYREVPAFANEQQPPKEDPRPQHVREDDEDYEPPQRPYTEVSDL